VAKQVDIDIAMEGHIVWTVDRGQGFPQVEQSIGAKTGGFG
jgi:hypothetical protein